ncbi:MAG: hypothetical protein WAZ27_01515 [Minisyncoccia bacterium]
MQRIVIAVAVTMLIFLTAWWMLFILPAQKEPLLEPTQEVVTPAIPETQWQWSFAPAGEDAASGAPKTTVTLRNGETSYSIGTYIGSCVDMQASSWKLAEDEGEIAGAVCWWAGGGQEIGVFSEDGKAVIKVGDIDEGDAENPGFRGNWRTLFEIAFGYVRSADAGGRSIEFDDAAWLSGKPGEDAAIAAGICSEETRSDCLPNDFYIYNEEKITTNVRLAQNVAVYMVTLSAETNGVKREYVSFETFAKLVNDSALHWQKLPYNVSTQNGEVIMIEEVYIP